MTMQSRFREVEKRIRYIDVTVTAALLDAAGSVAVITAKTGEQWRIREIMLIGGGTNFGVGGDRTITLTDGTTVWTTIANADLEAAPANTLRWGDAKVPNPTNKASVASVVGTNIRFQYAGGTTDHGAVGSIMFTVALSKVAP